MHFPFLPPCKTHKSSEPSLDTSVDSYPIQPLANKPVVMRTNADITGGSPATSSHPSATYASIAAHRGPATNATLPPSSSHVGPPGTSMSSPLPSGSGPPPQTGSGGANPYRMGLVGARKAAGGYVPVTGPPPQPISQPMMGVVPSSLPQMQPPPHSQPMIPAMPQVHSVDMIGGGCTVHVFCTHYCNQYAFLYPNLAVIFASYVPDCPTCTCMITCTLQVSSVFCWFLYIYVPCIFAICAISKLR